MTDVLRFVDLRSFCEWAQMPLPKAFDADGSGGFDDLGHTWVEIGRVHKGWHVMCLDSGHLVAAEHAFTADGGPVRYLVALTTSRAWLRSRGSFVQSSPPHLDDLADALRPYLSEDSSGSPR